MATDKKGAFLARAAGFGVEVINYDAIGKNSEAFTVGDPVSFASGQLAVSGATSTVAGIVVQTVTVASNNVGGANQVVGYIPVDETTVFRMTSNSDLTGNSTDPGTYYKLVGTTGAVQLDGTAAVSTTSRVVMIKKVDPDNIGGTGAGSGLRQVEVIFVRRPTWIDQ